ncbi:PAS domain S-box protein [Microscilla marina]|uniref:Chemotaxis protein n=1 Tax=Microscilla marina ATCC 23134 TaxID=313606 RepID=A1ZLK5_MICM2|nr:PAS domain S-box protein [Microscilla marina]EAY28759.1 chemotaxis protein [Microscilla marina ATCC 23134]
MAKKGENKEIKVTTQKSSSTIRQRIIRSFAVLAVVMVVFTAVTLNELNKISRINAYIDNTINPTKVHLQALNEMVNRSSIFLQVYMIFENNNQKVEGDYKQKRASIWKKEIKQIYDTLAVYEQKWQNLDMKLKYLNLQTILQKLENSQILIEEVIAKRSDDIYNLENIENLANHQNDVLLTPQTSSREDAFSKRVLPLINQVHNEVLELQSIQNRELEMKHGQIAYLWNVFWMLFVALGVVLFAVMLYLIRDLSHKILRNIYQLRDYVRMLRKGELPKHMKSLEDETSEIVEELQLVTYHLQKTKDFSLQIADGNLESKLDVFEEHSEMGKAFNQMQEGLKQIAIKDQERKWVNEGLTKFNSIVRESKQIQDLADEVISNLVKYLSANQGGIFVLNDKDYEAPCMELTSVYAFDRKRFLKRQIYLGQGLAGQSWQEKDAVYLQEVPSGYTLVNSGLGSANPRSILVIPMIVNEDDVVGIIELASFHLFKDYEIEFVKKLAENIGASVTTLKNNHEAQLLLNEAQETAKKLKRKEEESALSLQELVTTQEEMKKSQAELTGQMTAINTTLATAEFDMQGTILNANNLFLEMFGYSIYDIKDSHHSIFVDPKEVEKSRYKKFWLELQEGLPQTEEFKRITKDGREIWLNASYTPVKDVKGRPYKVIELAIDITEQKQLSMDFKGELEAINKTNAVVEYDTEGYILNANNIFLQLMGYRLNEIKGKHHSVLVDTKDPATVQYMQDWKKLARGKSLTGEFQYINKSGEKVWVRSSYNPILDLNGQPYKIQNFAQDINDVKTYETELKENASILQKQKTELEQNQLALTGQITAINTALATAEFDMEGNILEVNNIFLDALKYNVYELKEHKDILLLEEGAEDMATYKKFWSELRRGIPQIGEFKRVAKDGKAVWLNATFTPVKDITGVPYKVIQLATVITQQKVQNMDYEGQMSAINKSNLVIEFDMKGYILHANQRFLDLMQYKLIELVNKNHNIFVDDFTKTSDDYKTLWEKLFNGEYVSGRFRRVKKDGTEIWFSGTYNPIFDLNGEPYKIVKFAQDITEVKYFEVKARQNTRKLKKRTDELLKANKAIEEIRMRDQTKIEEKKEEIAKLKAKIEELSKNDGHN